MQEQNVHYIRLRENYIAPGKEKKSAKTVNHVLDTNKNRSIWKHHLIMRFNKEWWNLALPG